MSKKHPTVAPGINYQSRWENATKEDEKEKNITKVTSLIYDEYDPTKRRNYHDENK